MLIEVRCNKLREKKIVFHNGLNVVLGDEIATNSIGKSTLLMIIDFIFGGDTFIDHNRDAVDELGNHDYFFTFQFENNKHYFKRGTFKPDLIHACNDKDEEVNPISIDEYRAFLKTSYALYNVELTFRSLVSLFSRIWGKENLDVKEPLHSFKKQSAGDCVENVLKIFQKYEPIKLLTDEVKAKKDEKTIINKAFKKELIPKITKRQYEKSLERITAIDKEISDIKINLAKYAVNISEIANREILELKGMKDKLLSEKANVESRLSRVKNDLVENKHIKSKHLEPLMKFFPEVNMDRIAEVEEFHSKLSRILRSELKESEKDLTNILNDLTSEIEIIDKKITSSLKNLDNPNIIVDRVYDLSLSHANTSLEIEYFVTANTVAKELKDAQDLLKSEKERLLKFIEDVINEKTRKYVNKIYNEERRSPILTLKQNNYTFEAVEDTGTGKAYSNLILLDLAFLKTTELPFVIHDSLLFKNIENEAVSKLIDLYESLGKQTFIAIDEIKKYGPETEKKLHDNKVIQLSNNHVLYIKDWRK